MKIESLEPRIAPAGISLSYTDFDGDLVTIKTTAGDLTAPGVAVFGFVGEGEQLFLLNLTDPVFQGASITTQIHKRPGGDGLVHIGRIDATGRDLGSVKINGDLSVVDAGDADASTPALKILSVRSMGSFALATQGGTGDLQSDIVGSLGSLKVAGDFNRVSVEVRGVLGVDPRIGSIKIGGSMIGGDSTRSGSILSDGSMGPVKIGGDLIGGSGARSASFQSATRMDSFAIAGSVLGGSGNQSGFLSVGDLGPVKVGRDVMCGVVSGFIISQAGIDSLTIRQSFINRHSDGGAIVAHGAVGSVRIGGDIDFPSGKNALLFDSCVSITVLGSVAGGISSGAALGSIMIGHDFSGRLSANSVKNCVIGGSLLEGAIRITNGDAGKIRIGGDVTGGGDLFSGSVSVTGDLGSIVVGGSVIGGEGDFSGAISSSGKIGSLKISGNLCGGNIREFASSDQTGYVSADRIGRVFIGGSIIAGTDDSTGTLKNNASIVTQHDIGSMVVKGSLLGRGQGENEVTVVISARGQELPGSTTDIAIKSLTIGGGVEWAKIRAGFAPDDPDSEASNPQGSIGAVKVRGNWIASSLTAGVSDVLGNGFGNIDDAVLGSSDGGTIQRIAIKGFASGSGLPGDHFGFVAQQIGAFKTRNTIAKLTSATDTPTVISWLTADIGLLEV